jgi:biopolymer transport protein ExbB/TolQ
MMMISEAFRSEDALWMFLILGVSIVALGIIVERFVVLYLKYNINGPQFMSNIQKLVMQNNIDRAVKHCNASAEKALARVLKAGLTRANKNELEIGNAIEEAQLEVVPAIQKRLGNLPVLANVATLMGLLGTIVGMIKSFQGLGAVSADKRQEVLSSGISLAMYATAFGLIVAIPALLAHVLLNNKARNMIVEIDQYATKLQNLLVSRLRGGLATQGEESAAT